MQPVTLECDPDPFTFFQVTVYDLDVLMASWVPPEVKTANSILARGTFYYTSIMPRQNCLKEKKVDLKFSAVIR